MKLKISSAYRTIFISITALVGFYLLFIIANISLLSQASTLRSYHSFALYALNIDAKSPVSNEQKEYLKRLIKGGDLHWQGDLLSVKPLTTFVAPTTVDISPITSAIDTSDATQLAQAAPTLRQLIDTTIQRKQRVVVIMQPAVAVLTIVFYVLVFLQVIKRSQETNARDEQVKEEADSILSTVTEGLFLMRADFEIGIEQSASLKDMFRSEQELQGNFFDFISQYVSPNTLQIAKDYIGLLFGERVKEKLVRDLNPLNQVEISILGRDGSIESRFLDFSFKRVSNQGTLSHLLCSVTDVTREVILERQLQQAQEEQEAQLDLLLSVLHIPPAQLQQFFSLADTTLNDINQQLESQGTGTQSTSGFDKALRNKLSDMAAPVHRLKGDAAALGLNNFEFLAHDFEEEIATALSSEKTIDGKSLLPVVAKLRSLFNDLDQMRTLVNRFAELSQVAPTNTTTPSQTATNTTSATATNIISSEPPPAQPEPEASADAIITTADTNVAATNAGSSQSKLQQLCSTVAARQNKNVQLSLAIDALDQLHHEQRQVVDSILVQLLRNSIVHGIETRDTRQQLNKPETGTITISADLDTDQQQLRLQVLDDGSGIDEAAVIAKGKQLGLISEADSVSKKQLLAILFKPGLSSSQTADLDSGRGVGLDAVAKLVKQQQGKLSLNYVPQQHCRFKIVLPIAQS